MTQEYSSMANSIIMWLACAPGVLIVLFQAYLFFRRGKKDALRVGLTEKQVKAAIRSATVTSIGPCFVMLTAMLSLMLYVGAPLAWLRVDFIGSVSYELQGANFAAEGMGIELGTAAMDASYLSTASIVMTMGCIGWVIFAALFSDKMEKVNAVMSGGNELLVPILGTGALIGVYASLTMDRLYPFKNQGFAVLSSAALMFLIQSYNKKANKQWLKEWGLTICMVFGMICATVSEQFIML